MYLARLMGFDYQIQYRAGIHNQAVDALSRLPEPDASLSMVLSVPSLTFLEELHRQLHTHPKYTQQLQAIQDDPDQHPRFSVSNNLVLYSGRIWLP